VVDADGDLQPRGPVGLLGPGHRARRVEGVRGVSGSLGANRPDLDRDTAARAGGAAVRPVDSAGAPGTWTTEFSSSTGDLRGTSQGRILYNEFFGDYVYAIATRTYGAGVWTGTERTADCPAMDAWRKASFDAGHRILPGAPWPLGDCPDQRFGNNDIFSATTG